MLYSLLTEASHTAVAAELALEAVAIVVEQHFGVTAALLTGHNFT